MTQNIKIANCSGFYGDNLSIARKMVEGGPIDVLTGDYLAELTMTILYNQKLKRGEDFGYVGTFLKQFKEVAKLCEDKKIKIVSNAGGLNPASMAKVEHKNKFSQKVQGRASFCLRSMDFRAGCLRSTNFCAGFHTTRALLASAAGRSTEARSASNSSRQDPSSLLSRSSLSSSTPR